MSQERASSAGRKFADDLRRIRDARGVSIEDLHDETKIPLGLLQDFERTALFDHSQFNRVYLRSFVRTYAQVLNISPEIAMDALEEALDGHYDNRLGVEYLGEKAPATAAPRASEERPPEKAEKVEPAAPPVPPGPPTPREGARDRHAVSPAGKAERATAAGAGAAGAGAAAGAAGRTSEDDWTATSPPGRRATAAAPPRPARPPRPSGGAPRGAMVAAGVVAVLVVAGLVWFLFLRGGAPDDPAAAGPVAADTAAGAVTPTPAVSGGRDPSTIPTLGDTMHVSIIAAEGKLDPIRVTIDDDVRRPYWAEQGDSLLFTPNSRIIVEELLDNIRLKIEGEPYPTNRRDAQGRIVLTRDTVQTYFQSLVGQPVAPSDSL